MAKRGRPLKGFSVNDFTTKILDQTRTKIIRENIQDVVKEAMYQSIKKNVYGRYEPSIYKRREENDGLLSKDNIRIHVHIKRDVLSDSMNKNWRMHITAANVAKPYGLPEFVFNVIHQTPLTTTNMISVTSNAKDLLYYWKDQGLVYNLFSDPNGYRWTAPANLNEGITHILFNQKVLNKCFGIKLKRAIKANNRSNTEHILNNKEVE